jgi:transcriptional regulator with XRE-family HTH domain
VSTQKPRTSRKFINRGEEAPDGAANDAIKATFGLRLQRLMIDKGWNQSELAREIEKHLPEGVRFGRDNVSNYIRGKWIPEPVRLQAICDTFGVTVDDLLPKTAIPSSTDRVPAKDVRDLGDGNVWLRINQATSWVNALRILEILEGVPGGKAKA